MDKTESTVRKMLTAMEAPLYDIGVLRDRGILPSTAFPPPRYSTRFRCSSTATYAARIYIRQSGEHRFTAFDDLKSCTSGSSRRIRPSTPWPVRSAAAALA
jgi:hypothetical protein